MHTDGESHPGSLPPECAVCSQLHVQVEAAWVCTSCRRLHGHNQLGSGSVGRRGIPPIAYDDTSESDDGPAPSTSLADNDRTDLVSRTPRSIGHQANRCSMPCLAVELANWNTANSRMTLWPLLLALVLNREVAKCNNFLSFHK